MEMLKPLVLKIVCHPKDEPAINGIHTIIDRLSSMKNSFGVDCHHFTLADIEKEELLPVSSYSKDRIILEKVANTINNIQYSKFRKDDVKEVGLPGNPMLMGNNKIIILTDFPVTDTDFISLTDGVIKPYLLFDGFIFVVSKGFGHLKSSREGSGFSIIDNPVILRHALDPKSIELNSTKSHYLKSTFAGDVTYDELDTMKPNEITGQIGSKSEDCLFDDFSKLVIDLATLKNGYQEWASDTQKIDVIFSSESIASSRDACSQAAINDYSRDWSSNLLLSQYMNTIDKLLPQQQTVGGVLYSIAHSISRYHGEDDWKYDMDYNSTSITGVSTKKPNVQRRPSVAITGVAGSVIEGLSQKEEEIQSSLAKYVNISLDVGDAHSFRYIQYRAPDLTLPPFSDKSFIQYLHGVIGCERRAIIHSQATSLLAHRGLVQYPTLKTSEMGVQETELLTFSSLSVTDLHRYRQLQIFDEMTSSTLATLTNFTGTVKGSDGLDWSILKRRYCRNINSFTLPQVIVKERLKEPMVCLRNYPMTDSLLLALHWPTLPRRMNNISWGPSQSLRSRVTFRDYVITQLEENFTPRTSDGLKCFININPDDLMKYEQKVLTITPADKSIVKLKQLLSTNECWLSIYIGDVMFGLRKYVPLPEPSPPPPPPQVVAPIASPTAPGIPVVSTAAPAPTTATVIPPVVTQTLSSNAKRRESKVTLPTEPVGCFVCEGEDGFRVTAGVLPATPGRPNLKPDKKLPVYLSLTFSSSLSILACSNGIIKMSKKTLPSNTVTAGGQSMTHYLDMEQHRLICGTSITRRLSAGPFSHDILYADGSRVLIRRKDIIPIADPKSDTAYVKGSGSGSGLPGSAHITSRPNSSRPLSARRQGGSHGNGTVSSAHKLMLPKSTTPVGTPKEGEHVITGRSTTRVANTLKAGAAAAMSGILSSILDNAPDTWTYFRLDAGGKVSYFSCEPGTTPEPVGLVLPLFADISKLSKDAESGCSIIELKDGRMILKFVDGIQKSYFPDGTVLTRHDNGVCRLLLVEKVGFAAVEIDLEIDTLSRDHAKGKMIPISRGGERVRCRIAAADGTALIMKYDTRVTSSSNGSLKLVRRDRTTVVARDGGEIIFGPGISWSPKNQKDFDKDCEGDKDMIIPIVVEKSHHRSNMFTLDSSSSSSSSSAAAANINATIATKKRDEYSQQSKVKPLKQQEQPSPSQEPSLTTKKLHANNKQTKSNLSLAKKSIISSPTNKKLTSVASTNGSKFDLQKSSSMDELLSTNAVETIYTFHVGEGQLNCSIEDNEHNHFQLDLLQPNSPVVELAGELAGLKPVAVSDSPLEPKLFIVNRSFEATEIVRIQDVTELERQVVNCEEDIVKSQEEVRHQLADLGGGIQNTYVRRKVFGSLDGFQFGDVFKHRQWYLRANPAAASLALTRISSMSILWSGFQLPHVPKVFEQTILTGMMPLSDEGYAGLRKAIKKWEDWKESRVVTINRFSVIDPRSQLELDQEAEIRKKLKRIYKTLKVSQKQRAKEGNVTPNGEPSPKMPFSKSASSASTYMESIEEASSHPPSSPGNEYKTLLEEEEEGFPEFSDSDEEPEERDPEDIEIAAAFEHYSVKFPNGQERVPVEDLRAALVQVYNRNVFDLQIRDALEDDVLSDPHALTAEEFRRLYYRLRVIDETDGSPDGNTESRLRSPRDSEGRRYSTLLPANPEAGPRSTDDNQVQLQLPTTMSTQQQLAFYRDPSQSKSLSLSLSANQSSAKVEEEQSFWNSRIGQSVVSAIPVMAPPLHMRDLDWTSQQSAFESPIVSGARGGRLLKKRLTEKSVH